MADIDREKLLNWLTQQDLDLKDSIDARHKEDPHDPTIPRLEGGISFIHLLALEISTSRLDVESWPKVPIDKISVPVQNKVRRNARGTSWAAATSQTPAKSQLLYKAIYIILTKKGPLTDEEILRVLEFNKIPVSDSGARARRSELVDAGWVRATDEKRPSKNGSPMTVWEAVPEQ